MNFIGLPRHYLRKLYPSPPQGQVSKPPFRKLIHSTLKDISVVMVNPWVMTGSSSAVLPFQQSSSTQRHPDRSTWRYISTEEFPANWPAAKQTPESFESRKIWDAGFIKSSFGEQGTGVAQVASGLPSGGWEEKRGQERRRKGVVIVTMTHTDYLLTGSQLQTFIVNSQSSKKSTVWYNYFIRIRIQSR